MLGAARRVARRYGGDFKILANLGNRGLHCGYRFGLVVLDADQYAFRLEQIAEDADAAHDFLGALAHQQVVASHERLTFGAVDNQCVHRHRFGWRQFGVRREYRTAESDDAEIAQDLAHLLGFKRRVIERRAFDPLVTAVGFDDDGERRQAGRMRRDALLDGDDGAGGRRMHG